MKTARLTNPQNLGAQEISPSTDEYARVVQNNRKTTAQALPDQAG